MPPSHRAHRRALDADLRDNFRLHRRRPYAPPTRSSEDLDPSCRLGHRRKLSVGHMSKPRCTRAAECHRSATDREGGVRTRLTLDRYNILKLRTQLVGARGPSARRNSLPIGMGRHQSSGGSLDSEKPHPSSMAAPTLRRQSPKVGAVCGSSARTVLCGWRTVMRVPTAIPEFRWRDCRWRYRRGAADRVGQI